MESWHEEHAANVDREEEHAARKSGEASPGTTRRNAENESQDDYLIGFHPRRFCVPFHGP
jgi:hypothetical protein